MLAADLTGLLHFYVWLMASGTATQENVGETQGDLQYWVEAVSASLMEKVPKLLACPTLQDYLARWWG